LFEQGINIWLVVHRAAFRRFATVAGDTHTGASICLRFLRKWLRQRALLLQYIGGHDGNRSTARPRVPRAVSVD